MSGRRTILALSSLYPRAARPLRGIFNYQALHELSLLADVTLFTPVSWIDRIRDLAGRGVHAAELSGDGPVPQAVTCFSVPIIGRGWNGYFQYRSLRTATRRLHRRTPFETILAYWVYPDGYAAHLLGRDLGIPFTVVALGSDLHLMGHSGRTRGRIQRTLSSASRVITVSAALGHEAAALGALPEHCRVVPNGIDPDIFFARPRADCRRQLKLHEEERVLLFVGNLERIKGPDLLLEALAYLKRDCPRTIFIGTGGERRALERRAAELGLNGRVAFTGPVPHREIASYLNAADFLVLPSRSEGCPNVILESLACGTPVIATAVGGVPELVTEPGQGILTDPENPRALAEGIAAALEQTWPRGAVAGGVRTWRTVAGETLAVLDEYLTG